MQAIDPKTGNAFTDDDATISVQAPGGAVPESSSSEMLLVFLPALHSRAKKPGASEIV